MTAQRREDIDVRLPSPEPEDKELTLAFQRGEKGAYQAIYDRYHQRVLNVCRRMLGKPEDAEEAAQEAFLRVYQALYRFNGRYQLGPWVTRIATNVCLDHLRSRARKPSEATSDELLELEIDTSDEDPEVIHLKRFEGRRVRRVLASLPPMHRAAIVLRDFEGLSYEEVAIALGITEVQVKALLHRARKSFKRAWVPLDGLQVVLPWKLVQKFKKVDVSAGEGATQVARASAPLTEAANSAAHLAHAASSCSVAIQQCGQFMAERATAFAATVIVGSAAIGGVAVGRATAPPAATPRAEIVASAQPVKEVLRQTRPRKPVQENAVAENLVAATSESHPAPTAPTPAPAASPAAQATATPAPAPSASSTPSEKGSGGSNQPPSPAPKTPFQVAIGFDRAGEVTPSQPESHTSTLDCATMQLRQEVVAPVWDEGGSYPGRLSLFMTASSAQLALYVQKNGVEYSYNGGASSVQTSKSGGQTTVTFSGSYSWNGGPPPSDAGLPESGRFSAKLVLDCASQRVVTESIALAT